MNQIAVPRYLIVIVSLVATWWLLQQAFVLVFSIADILLVFGLAWLLKLLLDPLIGRLERWHVPRLAAIAVAYLLTLGGVIVGLIWLIPQLPAVAENVPALAQQLAGRAQEIGELLQRRGVKVDINAFTSQIVSTGTNVAATLVDRAFNLVQSLASVLASTAVVVTVSVYMSVTSGRMTDVVRPVIPPRWRDEYDGFMRDVKTTTSSYIRGYFLVVALGSLISAIVLYGWNIPNATLWIAFTLVLRLLPFIGGTIADILLIVVLLLNLPLTAALVPIVLLVVYELILNNAVMPRVMSRELGIHPLLVLFAVLLGARIYGLAGVLFSIPAAAIIVTVIGKAINRYLLPLYNRRGWWTEPVPVIEQHAPQAQSDPPRAVAVEPVSKPAARPPSTEAPRP